MGVESYGLVGFYLTLQALFAVLDMGLTTTVSRELARLSASQDKEQEIRDLVRTLEVVYWVISVLIVVAVILSAPWISTKWLNFHELSTETVHQAIILMGIMIAIRMPYGFYCGGMVGLQCQVLLNVIKVVVETFRSGGAVLVLWWFSPEITSFFLWQLVVSVAGLLAMALALWRGVPKFEGRAEFKTSIFRSLWRFTAGMSVITIMSAILVQMDKIVLSKMLSLEVFAYYSLASSVAVGLYVLIGPVFSTFYPQFTQLLAKNEMPELKRLYHKSCQLMTVMVIPLALTISFFSFQILHLWISDEGVAENAAPILSILILGAAFNGMMNLPFALQLAYGWIRLVMKLNVVVIIALLPLLILAIEFYGATGAAMIWLLLNVASIIFGLSLMHRKVLKGELKYWLLIDFGLPSLVSLGVIICFWLALPKSLSGFSQLAWIMLAGLVAFALSVWTAPAIRHDLLQRVHAGK